MQELIYETKIYYGDTDAGKVVYHANYIKIFEEARTEYLHHYDISLTKLEYEHDTIFAVRKLNIDYIKPARLEDKVFIFTRIKELKKVSITFHQYMKLDNLEGGIICAIDVKLGCISLAMKPKPIPEFILKKWR